MRFPLFRRQPAEPPRHLIVGLGNPGAEYRHTRHNVGFRVLDHLAAEHRIASWNTEKRALVSVGAIAGVPVVLAKPITFMNLSGESVAPLLRMLGLTPEDLIVIYDEMDLPLGRLRVRRDGSAGGHNGIKSLIQHLKTESFPRVRIGVGRPPNGTAIDHVLGKWSREELEPLELVVRTAGEAVETILTDGLDAAMNRYNRA